MLRRSTASLVTAVFLLAPALTGSQSSHVATQWDGVFTDAQAGHGRNAYTKHCARCHGSDLQGLLTPIHYPRQSPTTPALVGDAFNASWDGTTLADLFERIRISMPQEAPGTVPPAVVADILAFLLQSGGWPAGASEVPAPATRLGAIQFPAHLP